jgi:four helix bundle protein
MVSKPEPLRARTKAFALRVVHLFRNLQGPEAGRILERQLLRSATSVAANYRAACRARSKAEFIAKIGLVVEEADESVFWLEMLVDGGIVARTRVATLVAEANELVAIFAASQRTARSTSVNRSLTR